MCPPSPMSLLSQALYSSVTEDLSMQSSSRNVSLQGPVDGQGSKPTIGAFLQQQMMMLHPLPTLWRPSTLSPPHFIVFRIRHRLRHSTRQQTSQQRSVLLLSSKQCPPHHPRPPRPFVLVDFSIHPNSRSILRSRPSQRACSGANFLSLPICRHLNATSTSRSCHGRIHRHAPSMVVLG